MAAFASAEELKAMKNPLIIDLRDPQEILAGKGGPPASIPHSVNVPWNTPGGGPTPEEFKAKLEAAGVKLPADKQAPIIIHCAAGFRAAKALAFFQGWGYSNAKNGGYPSVIWAALSNELTGPSGTTAKRTNRDSDYAKQGIGSANLYVVYSAFNGVMTSFGVAAAAFPLFVSKNERSRGRVADLAVRGLGPAFLSFIFVKCCGIAMFANLGTARRETGVNVPDQHIYTVTDGASRGSEVLMDDTGVNGRFNRAQRSIGNLGEPLPSVFLAFFLNSMVFPKAAAGLLAIFGASRLKGALDYTEDRQKRMSGNMLSTLAASIQDGMVLVAGAYATYLEYK